ncbi:MAG TPA: hypothetical protein VD994_03450, partial [Prosthecobacter sp.]|nr:hypothetical protein [Prosthecobacter sp.]
MVALTACGNVGDAGVGVKRRAVLPGVLLWQRAAAVVAVAGLGEVVGQTALGAFGTGAALAENFAADLRR